MKRKTFLLIAACYFGISLNAQVTDGSVEKPVQVKWSGFIMNNFFYDSRRMFDALDGLVLIFPLPPDLDDRGNDLNDIPATSFLSFATRLRANISGPDALGAVTTGYIEFDFTARANAASLRFRQAWVNFAWENTSLLAGRTWTPFVSIDVAPDVIGMNIGTPFSPFNRSDQLTLTHRIGNINLILSALYQNDYVNNGPLGRSPAYQNSAIMPNLHAQIKYKTENTILGLGVDYKKLKPRVSTISPLSGERHKSETTVGCPALLAYLKLRHNLLTISAKSILAANVSENIMTGAFAIKSVDPITGNEEYTPYKHWFLWSNVTYGKKLKAGLFGGYLKNLGAGENIVFTSTDLPVTVFGLGEKISEMYRISPSLSYTSGPVMLAFEVEHNIAGYGEINYGNKGKIINVSNVKSTRLLATMYYNF